MDDRMRKVRGVWAMAAGLALVTIGVGAMSQAGPDGAATDASPPSVDEARQRARLLHETLHDTLQLVHSRYYREDEGLEIPAGALKHVFKGLAERNGVELRWLAVNARAMSIDHNPRDEFEKEAAKALAAGKDEYELVAGGTYRYAGPITLKAECLKCHLPSRSSNDSRRAGLLIEMPIASKP